MSTRSYTEEVYKTYSAAKHRLGSLVELPDGRKFRFALNGAVALTTGKLVQMPVPAANHLNIAVAAAAAIGAKRVQVTLGATAAAADLYKDGYMYVNDVDGEGQIFRIRTHLAIASAGTGWIELYEDSPLRIALTTSSEVTLIRNPYAQVVVHPSPPTARLVGVAPCAVAAASYFWCQTWGPAVVLIDGTVVINDSVMASDAVDGAVEAWGLTEAAPPTEKQPIVGDVIAVNADTEYGMIHLRLE